MTAPDVVEELKAFGLSTYEAEAYNVLVTTGVTDANTVARKADVPFGRVYDVLNTLVEKNLAQVQDARPKLYRAVTPRIALANLLNQRKRDFDEKYAQLTRVAGEVEKRLAPRVKDKSSSFYTVAIGESDSRATLTERIREAEREILVNLEFKAYDPEDEALFEAFSDAVQRGVHVRVLVRDEDIPNILASPYNDLVARTMMPHLGKSLEVRVIAGEQVPFGVVDGEKALVGVKNPLGPAAYFALVFMWDPRFGKELQARFDELWKQADAAIPGVFTE
jgi:HTH-type transcriptional regulator, sugar sensing transcriptional regulator